MNHPQEDPWKILDVEPKAPPKGEYDAPDLYRPQSSSEREEMRKETHRLLGLGIVGALLVGGWYFMRQPPAPPVPTEWKAVAAEMGQQKYCESITKAQFNAISNPSEKHQVFTFCRKFLFTTPERKK